MGWEFPHMSGARGCLGEGRLGVPGQVWEFRFLLSFPSFPRENRSIQEMSGKMLRSPRRPSSRHPRSSENLVVSNLVVCNFCAQKRSFALFKFAPLKFCALLHSFTDFCLRSFALFCALLRSFFSLFCVCDLLR